jgi:hypothetical protein
VINRISRNAVTVPVLLRAVFPPRETFDLRITAAWRAYFGKGRISKRAASEDRRKICGTPPRDAK